MSHFCKLALALLLASSLSAAPKPAAKSAPTVPVTSAAPTGPTTIQRLEAQVADDAKRIAALQLIADIAELDRLLADLRAGFPHHAPEDRATVLKSLPRWAASAVAGGR